MKNFSSSPVELINSLWRNHGLIFALVRREVLGRYRGSMLGLFWSVFHPLFMLFVYTFVFSVIFKSRWGSNGDSKTEFALVLFAGLLIFNLFSECLSRAPGLVLANVNYVKKVVFPLEVLPWVTIGSAIFHTMISFGVWLMFYLIFFGTPQPTIFLFPLVLAPLVFLTLGFLWFFASLGVFLRDLGQIINLLVTVLMFLSPVFYPVSALPSNYQVFIKLNPLTMVIEQARDVLIWGKPLDTITTIAYFLISWVVAWLGFAWFQKTRKGFADVL